MNAHRFRILFAALLIVMAGVFGSRPTVHAQTPPPPQIATALTTLGNYLQTQIAQVQLDTYSWQALNYTDSHLGCPFAVFPPVPGNYVGYIFLLTYAGVTYDVRVSADQTIAFMCLPDGNAPIGAATPTASAPLQAGNSGCPQFYTGYLRPRLRVGGQASIAADGTPNRLRSGPSVTAGQTGTINPGGTVDVLAGPVCEAQTVNNQANIVFWQVRYAGQTGWTAEGLPPADYFLDPVGGTLFTERGIISPATALSLSELAVLPFDSALDFDLAAPEGEPPRLVAVSQAGYAFFNLDDLSSLPLIDRPYRQITAVASSPDGRYLAFGFCDGVFTIVDTLNNTETVRNTLAGTCISDLAFNPADSRTLAVSTEAGNAGAFGVIDAASTARGEAAYAVFTQPGVLVDAVAFSPSGALVAYRTGNSRAVALTTDTYTELFQIAIAALPGLYDGVAFAPANAQNAAEGVAVNDGAALRVIDTVTTGQRSIQTFRTGQSSSRLPTAFAWNADGTLIAIASQRDPNGTDPDTTSLINLHDARTGQVLTSVIVPSVVTEIQFTADDTLLIAQVGPDVVLFGIP
ncbi:MAG: hypothetical protein SF162_14345 [bacterium]|nr:hypothetical protein [bacterium]